MQKDGQTGSTKLRQMEEVVTDGGRTGREKILEQSAALEAVKEVLEMVWKTERLDRHSLSATVQSELGAQHYSSGPRKKNLPEAAGLLTSQVQCPAKTKS